MALTSRITLSGAEASEPEDYLSSALGVIFPDDVTNQHGDSEHSLIYTSPRLPKPLLLDLADPVGDTDRRLFSHYLWNASLLLAELVERDSLPPSPPGVEKPDAGLGAGVDFDVRGLDIMELGAGTALPSMMAGLLGARRVVVTDYPAPTVMKTLRANIARNIRPELAPAQPDGPVTPSVLVEGHAWGELAPTDALCAADRHAFDRLLVCDCLWMPWQHANLHASISHFLRAADPSARAWVVAGFHTGRDKMRGFFDADALAAAGLELDRAWERECDGKERPWSWDREEDVTVRKRWLVVASLKRTAAFMEASR
ncbi:nicotinamide N-methyltransferase [Paramyrothecium foliicola]|nr:nicotinamide N-methyltransferase [Paramyrothecium foliicola]